MNCLAALLSTSAYPCEHDMQIAVASDWIIDIGPGAGNEGGQIVVQGTPSKVAKSTSSRTAPFLARQVKRLKRC